MRISRRVLSLAFLLVAGCGDDDARPGDGTTTSGSTTTSGGGGSGGGEVATVPLPLAAGIAIDRVEVNQAVGVYLVDAGAVIEESARRAPLIEGRPGLLRVLWQVEPGFVPREIEAHVELVGATSRTLVLRKSIEGPAGSASVEESFAWTLAASDLDGVTSYAVSLHDVADGPVRENTGQRLPQTGTTALGLITDPMDLSVVVIPASIPCGSNTLPTIGNDEKAIIETQVKSLFPIRNLEVTYHAPFATTVTDCGDLDAILTELSALRESEALGTQYYYHAVFPNADETPLNIGGYSWIETEAEGADRVSFSVNWWGEPTEVLNNVAHELGHSHGRYHSFQDPSYEPGSFSQRSCGRRDEWGYGAFSGPHPQRNYYPDFAPFQNLEGWLVRPTAELGGSSDACETFPDGPLGPTVNDVMGYAHPYWVGAYTYSALAERVRVVNQLAMRPGAGPTGKSYALDRSVHVVLSESGPIWQVHRGAVDARAVSGSYAELRDSTGARRIPAVPKINSEGKVRGYALTLPRGESLESVDAIEVVAADRAVAAVSGTAMKSLRASVAASR